MLALQAAKQIDDLGPDAYVERRNRLVQDQQPGSQSQGACDVDALPLPAGEFVRMAGQRRVIEADFRQKFDRAGARSQLSD